MTIYTLAQITDQQAIGHMLQNLVRLHAMVESMSNTQSEVERLKAFVGMEEERPKKKEKQKGYDNESED